MKRIITLLIAFDFLAANLNTCVPPTPNIWSWFGSIAILFVPRVFIFLSSRVWDKIHQTPWLLKDDSRCLLIKINLRAEKPFDSNENILTTSIPVKVDWIFFYLIILTYNRQSELKTSIKAFSPERSSLEILVTVEWLLAFQVKRFFFRRDQELYKAPLANLESSYFQQEMWSHVICVIEVRSVARRLN